MTRTRRFTLRRLAGLALAAGLIFVLVGDRGSTAAPPGIDPLEVLNLQVKPNVMIVLDSSGSMQETPYGRGVTGDHPFSKMFEAKTVMNAVITANADKAQFLFGQYRTSVNASTFQNLSTVTNGTPSRFRYNTRSFASGTFANPICALQPSACPVPNPNSITLGVEGEGPTMASKELFLSSFYAFQWIRNDAQVQNNRFVFSETGGATNCTVTIPTGFYASGTALATVIANAMNNANCTNQTNKTTGVTYSSGVFTFANNGPNDFTLNWGSSSIAPTLNRTGDQSIRKSRTGGTGDARYNLLSRGTGSDFTESYDPDGASKLTGGTLGPYPAGITNPSPTRNVTTYLLYAQRFWNGETVYVTDTGAFCGFVTGTGTKPPSVTLQRVTACGTTAANGTMNLPAAASIDAANKVTFTWSGGDFGGTGSCRGFQQKVALVPCDSTTSQVTDISPLLDPELRLDQTTGAVLNYKESNDGKYTVTTVPPPGGIIADGGTPIAQSLNDIKGIFNTLWNSGQVSPAVTPIKNHSNPKERTIVLFVTDGDQNCSPFSLGMSTGSPYSGVSNGDDAAALGAAASAQKLYNPFTVDGVSTVNADGTINGDAAASVQTYLVAFGAGAAKNRADYIAWGGSGMVRPFGQVSGSDTWTTIPTTAERNKCKTCVDAFLAPDADTLKAVLETVINQGASSGEFTAQRSTTAGVFELVGLVPGNMPGIGRAFSPLDVETRYGGLVPVLFQSTFKLPLFDGQVRAYISDNTSIPVEQWNAGQKLTDLVKNGMTAQCPANATAGTLAGQCMFSQLHAGATDSNIALSNAALKRRIYTTSQNGAFTPTVAQLLASQSPSRLALWPPDSFANPSTGPGSLDDALGVSGTGIDFAYLQTTFLACKGTVGGKQVTDPTAMSPSHPCSAAATQLATAKLEARRRILAYTAGAEILTDSNGDPARIQSGANKGEVLYVARNWSLAESTLGAPAVVPPPIGVNPGGPFSAEYDNYVYGPRTGTDNLGGQQSILEGFGLTFPDSATKDTKNPGLGGNPSPTLVPVMTVLYVGANDMLHAFRAAGCQGSCQGGSYTASDTGGEELWGFVPYDQLSKLQKRMLDFPQKRDPHDYMISTGMRFADIFVPGAVSTAYGVTGQGVWRRVLFFGRGIGGKYVTALDITAAGPFTLPSLDSKAPVVLWNRGNPDTSQGALGGSDNNTYDPNDKTAFSRMGQTWSVPAVAYVPTFFTKRKPSASSQGVSFVLFMGSGYGDTSSEGTTFYTLDALTGDVIAAPDVTGFAPARTPAPDYPNALVADAVDFNEAELTYGTGHPFSTQADRAYIGDLHGRLWKLKVSDLNTPIFFADLGADQPVGAPVGVFMDQTTKDKFVYVVAGNDNRVDGPFKYFAFKDDDGPTPATPIFSDFFADQRTATPPEHAVNFRGTSQPLTALTAANQGRVFFVPTRFNTPNSEFAPAPYPCRSSFDSALYALGALSGQAAYDFATAIGSPSDAYAILKDSRKTGIQEIAPPGSTGTGKVIMDEGLSKGPPEPPPYRGLQPVTVTSGSTYYVGPYAPGGGVPPAASMRYVPTVCQ